MKITVSNPEGLFQSAEKLAARLGVSRSELYTRALAGLVERHLEAAITVNLNAVYRAKGEDSTLDRGVALLQSRSLLQENG